MICLQRPSQLTLRRLNLQRSFVQSSPLRHLSTDNQPDIANTDPDTAIAESDAAVVPSSLISTHPLPSQDPGIRSIESSSNKPNSDSHLPRQLERAFDWAKQVRKMNDSLQREKRTMWRCKQGVDEQSLHKAFLFPGFKKAWEFMDVIAQECKRVQHHPEWSNNYNRVVILWTTHDANTITEKDIQMAQFCDQQYYSRYMSKSLLSAPPTLLLERSRDHALLRYDHKNLKGRPGSSAITGYRIDILKNLKPSLKNSGT